ncbi:Ig-like domain-containing protein [Microbacterium sp. A93]|uniref:Ig-like domain-containing protein n=1 Tax=Microbacterium sp. A93 TaxID=3450716 RepID=UPI003F435930
MRAKPRSLASAAFVTAGAIAIVTLAFTHDGNPTTKVTLNDGGVWLTKSSTLMLGHFNNESTVLDGGLVMTSGDFDILQDASTVLVVNDADSTLTTVDPARVSLTDSTTIPSGAEVALGAETAAILDPASGDLWVLPAAGISGFELQGTKPLVELGENSDVAVAQDGTVYALSAQSAEVITIPVDAEGNPLEPQTSSLGELNLDAVPSITAVGRTAVVLSPADGEVITVDGVRTPISDAETAVLQQVSADTEAVTVATSSHLVRVPLDGSAPQETSSGGQGVPAAPVWLRGCTYAAWAESGKFVRECPGETNDVVKDIPGVTESAQLTFRVNRDVIVLNDVVSGAAWRPDERLEQVDDWNQITAPEGETDKEELDTDETVETTLPERSAANTPPVAEDDSYGVRAGQSTLIPLLENDNDSDGDVLVAKVAGQQPSIGTVQPVYDGESLQIAVDPKASGAASFSYEIDDGRGGTDQATVSLSVYGEDPNSAPTSKRTATLTVEVGGTISYNLLPDWIDPEGDDLYLKEALAAPGDKVEFSADGQMTYHAVASTPGYQEIQVTVADSRDETASGVIRLDVRPAGSTSPKTNADHVVTAVGQQVTVAPLTNDTSSGSEPLRLTRVEQEGGSDAMITPDFANGTFTFSIDRLGVHYIKYLVAAGPNAVPGLARIDVRESVVSDLAPVAVRDVALLPSGGEILLGVLNNDTDPSGGILVVQSVTVESDSGISVSVLNHETLRIGDQGTLADPVRITYRISNGSRSAEGDVIVIPIPAPKKILPPVANEDHAVVRAGDVVTIPVLANDTHPNEDVLHLSPELIEPLIDPLDGEIFVSQNTVRFKAGDVAKTVYATYEAVDTHGQKAAGYITIEILAVDTQTNIAPRPRDLTARTLSGSTVNIAVPLDGIDADGDSVELVGIDSSPKKGRIIEVASDYITYEAYADAGGVDTFTYRVRDRLGMEGTASISVGVAAGEDLNQAPYAVKDAVAVRPGREVAVSVMANDSDPEGELVSLVEDGLTVPDLDGLSARVSGDRVLVQAPERPVETSLRYTIGDERGATSTAALQVTVDDDVPLLAPIARDDRIRSADVDAGSLIVDVIALDNDEDPDGTSDALDIEVGEGGTLLDNRAIRVTIGEQMQLIRYTITDQDELSTSAFIFVPALSDLRPTLTSAEPIVVVSGETRVLPLAEHVTVAGGGPVVITEKSKITAAHSDGADLLQDASTLVYTSAPGYFGGDSLTFEVTDGTGPDDPNGRKATLTMLITVLPPANQQPIFTRGEMDVAPGESAAPLDLQALTTDPDPGDTAHDFQLVGDAGEGLTARIDEGLLSVQAASNVRKGTTATLTIRVSDGETEPVDGEVTVQVNASTRDLATANTDTIDNAVAGETISIPVLANDVNPFPETPLKIVAVGTETGDGVATIDGENILVTPGARFMGTLIVRYTIQDATQDAERQADGQIVLTVQGAPDAPGRPAVTSVRDRTVVVSFTPPPNNGSPILNYTVSAVQGGDYSTQCESTTCTLAGLTNNSEYAFAVTATNDVGESEASEASEVVRPDARPDTPTPPSLKFGDSSLSVAWKTPSTPGSPVESFTLEISPAPPSGITQKTALAGNTTVWEGLENGTDYQVRVKAHNRASEPSSWSSWSVSKIPAGAPGAPEAPATAPLDQVGAQAQMRVSWNRPAANGDPVSAYQLRILRGGNVVETLAASTTSQAVTVSTSESTYTFQIRALNKAGWGGWSGVSAERRGVVAPGAPTAVAATAGDNTVTVTYAAGPRNGARADEVNYQYRVGSGAWRGDWDGALIGNGHVNNNGTYSIQVRAVATVDGSTYVGAASQPSGAVAPSGPPGEPIVTGTNEGKTIVWRWTLPNRNGSDLRVRWAEYNAIDGGRPDESAWSAWSNWNPGAGSYTGNYGFNQFAGFFVQVQDREGRTSETFERGMSNMPQIQFGSVTKGSKYTGADCTTVCNFVRLNTWEGFPAGEYTVECLVDGVRFPAPHVPSVHYIAAGSSIEPGCWRGDERGEVTVKLWGFNEPVSPIDW